MTLAELFEEHIYEITPANGEVDAWNTIAAEPDQEDETVTTSVGLFGADLVAFNAACVELGEDCDVADYADYNGWGVGISFASPFSAVASTFYNGVVFTTSKITVEVNWTTVAGISAGVVTVEPAEDAPTD